MTKPLGRSSSIAIEPSPPVRYCSSMFCAWSTTASPIALIFRVWPATARRCCTPASFVWLSRKSTLNSRRASRVASSLGAWRRSAGLGRSSGLEGELEGTVRVLFVLLVLVLTNRVQSDLVFLDLAVKPRSVNAQHVRRFLFVSTSALKRALDYVFFDLFQRHVR